MFSKFLVPLDGSDQSERIGRWVIGLAETLGARTTLLSVVGGKASRPGDLKEQETEARRYLRAVTDRAARDPRSIDVRISTGKTGEAIVETAQAASADVIALSTRRASSLARTILGSVTDHVLQNTPVPVLVANANCQITQETSFHVPETVIVPLDGSAVSEQVLPAVYEFAGRAKAGLLFLQSSAMPFATSGSVGVGEAQSKCLAYLKPFADRAKELGVHAEVEAESGTAAKCILHRAERAPRSLVVMATHGHTGFRRAVLGSVTNQVIRFSTCPVLVIPSRGNAGGKPERSRQIPTST